MDINEAAEIAKAMIAAIKPEPVRLDGTVGYNPSKEFCNGGFLGVITRGGAEILKDEIVLETFSSVMRRVVYNKEGGKRVAYIVNTRMEVDSFGEKSLVFEASKEPENIDIVISLFGEAETLQDTGHTKRLARLKELDKHVPQSFRRMVLDDRTREVAKNIYLAGGVLSQAVFEPYKGTLAYPETEKEASAYFERDWHRRPEQRDTLETAMLVGELVAKGLLE